MTTPIRILSYNIRKAVGTDRRRDPHRILTILKEAQADIVILQEADLRLGQRRTALPMDLIPDCGLVPVPIAVNGVSLGWHGNAILVRPDWAVAATDRITLPGLEPRGAISALVRTPLGPLRVIGAHLGLLRRSRLGQQQALIDWIAEQDTGPMVIGGDLNEWSARRGLGPLARVFALHTPGHSYHARWRLAPLDRIGLSEEIAMHDLSMIDTTLSRKGSDHLPIRASVTWPTATAGPTAHHRG
ncbi:Metal-dependent hydrolase, endonuclease/exonuclease/phosphatase family [Loktanella fryxellensis]|uniref:Metal-dependent hydrolase, endonuclease/exonuclease/phosphatase family n=1 Tax=Loktanella fryxellensis TaxID=245187 RepID=A0A1H8DQ24_9RHOB|nr:endonuclease/exonuclease/phosphatase family protein [Loktanella fryxellensis]SEN09372.1 Metal-dependent hydrolase, endonuclease/exonuclease/phosphatase family [Loktanella fryxellensis]